MRQRIRYAKHTYHENSKISCRAYTSQSTGAKYRIILDLDEMKFYIRNERNKEYVFKSTAKCTNLNVLKRNARAKLGYYGVRIESESRDRTFGLCNKDWSQEKQLEIEKSKKEDI